MAMLACICLACFAAHSIHFELNFVVASLEPMVSDDGRSPFNLVVDLNLED